jgi:hypothetical protein
MPHEITLHLNDVHHLFNAPEFDLFSPHPRSVSGIESIMQELKPMRLQTGDALHTSIVLPPEQITPDLPQQIRAAVARYTEQKIREMDGELASLRTRGFRALRTGMLFLGACLLLGALAERAEFLPHWLSSFLYNGFTIIGWVSLWHPAEAVLFDWAPYWLDKRLYRRIAAMEIEIKPASS